MWKKWSIFWSEGLWNFPLSDLSGWRAGVVQWLRIIALAIQGFKKDQLTMRASSLTFYALMSIVPLLALIFAIARGFGIQEFIRNELLERFKEHHVALTEIIQFAERLLQETKGGVIAGIGFIVLFWSALRMLANIEETLNHIWEVPKMRSLRILFSEYISMLVIAPLFFVLSNSAVVFAAKYLDQWVRLNSEGIAITGLLLFLVNLLPYCLFWLFFTFLYFSLPNTKVSFSSAFIGGIITGTLYLFVQWGYVHFQIGVNQYGAVYGSFAALPLFLIWLQVSWILFLFGAELSHAFQTFQDFEYKPAVERMGFGLRKMLSVWILYLCISRFSKEGEPMNFHCLVHAHRIPAFLAKRLLQDLIHADLILETKNQGYVPKRAVEHFRIADAALALEGNQFLDIPSFHSKELAHIEKAFLVFRKSIEATDANQLLKDL